ncbi:hypothetical protein F66182_1423 [Fusarium sp. NRRL 66182]|nr:hypothetical protein F66182_1423 [Fusarium sp. NRRL 66182]
MDAPVFEKLRGSLPSREALLGFINDGDFKPVAIRDSSTNDDPQTIDEPKVFVVPEVIDEPKIVDKSKTSNEFITDSEHSFNDESVHNDEPSFSEGPVLTEGHDISETLVNQEVTLIKKMLINNETIMDGQESIMAIKPPKPSILFDANGDLHLEIGSDPIRDMTVDSRALCRASMELQAILSQNGKQDSDSSWTIYLPEDDPAPFIILLNLIHARFQHVPSQVSIDLLYGICILTSKYNMTQVLRPVAERWYKAIERPVISDPFFHMVFVAWELGFEDDLSQMTGQIVHNCFLNESNKLAIGKNKQALAEIKALQSIPILQCIKEHRDLVLQTCLEECQRLNKFLLSQSRKGFTCESLNQDGASRIEFHEQDVIFNMIGRMMSQADANGILDLFSCNSELETCESLHLDLETLLVKISKVATSFDLCHWCSPVFGMVQEISAQFCIAEDPLYRMHFQALKVQAAKVRMGMS